MCVGGGGEWGEGEDSRQNKTLTNIHLEAVACWLLLSPVADSFVDDVMAVVVVVVVDDVTEDLQRKASSFCSLLSVRTI